MRYYCKNCGTEFTEGSKKIMKLCFYCEHDCITYPLEPIPDFETVSQWEKRTGRKYPDTAPVYHKSNLITVWYLDEYANTKKTLSAPYIVATEAGAPPDSWRPKNEI